MDSETRERVKSNPVYRVLRWTIPWIVLGAVLFFARDLWREFQVAEKNAPVSADASGVLSPSVGETLTADAIILIEGLKLRESPDTDAKVIAQLKKGAKVAVYELKNGWYRVKDPTADREGWISANAQYVKRVQPGK